ncbi:MAG: hypothetical protein U1G05_19145 [Kiritimatiellia bacterium]
MRGRCRGQPLGEVQLAGRSSISPRRASPKFPVGQNGQGGSYAGTSISTPGSPAARRGYLEKNPAASSTDAVNALLKAVKASPAPAGQMGAGVLDDAALTRLMGGK